MLTRKERAGFTITELLVVIGIMGLLMMIGIPTFRSASRGGGMRAAVFQLNSTFSLARQTAITTRQRVSILFPDDRADLYSGLEEAHVEKAFRSYAVYGARDGYISEWRVLPQGVVFDPFEGVEGRQNIFLVGNATMYLLDNIPFPDNQSNRRKIHALTFRPEGRPHPGGPTIYLSAGTAAVDPLGDSLVEIVLQADVPFRAISINNVTGQSRMREFLDEDRL